MAKQLGLRALQIALMGVAALLLVVAVFVLVGPKYGYQFAVVKSGSMRPTLPVGSIVVSKTVAANKIQVGDVISWRVSDPRHVITHRVLEITEAQGQVAFRTKGDNNEEADSELVPASALKSRAVFQVPVVGKLAPYLRRPELFLALVVIPGAIVIAMEVSSIVQELKGSKKKEAAGVIGDYES